jgi:hypothetical protein
MLTRIALLLSIFAAVMGFALGGSLVASFQIPLQEQQNYTADSKAEHASTENSEKSQSLWIPIDSVGLYTLVLAVFTGLLVFVSGLQGYFLLRADKTARIAANAAKASADAAIATERARLYLVETHSNFLYIINVVSAYSGPVEGATISTIPAIKVRFKNYGKSPGTLQAICCELKFSPNPFDFICSPRNNISEAIIEPGDSTDEITCIIDPLTVQEANEIKNGIAYLWLYGRAYYKDIFEQPQVHRFYRRFARLSEFQYGMRGYEYKDYNKST